jgi:uncharacterized BrkB/YihY/UPF0761 family membrane protein
MRSGEAVSERPLARWLFIIAVAMQGVSGVGGGIGLVADPSGAALGMPLEWLDGSPFSSYLVPGAFLLLALGVVPLAVAYGLWRGGRWSWYGALAVGVMLVAWIVVEIAIVGYQPQPPLQLIYGVLGCVILLLVFTPANS